MPGSGPGQHDDLAFLPERVARKTFTASFRGFDQLEVKAYLGELATELRHLRERDEQLRQELIDARLLAERAQQIDESQLTAVLGEETARVLDTARKAAAQITAKAEERAAQIVQEGHEEANRLRTGAQAEIERRVSDRERELTAAIAETEARRKEVEDQATREIVAARERGREMVAEAQLVRERVLKDMVRRRRMARQQIEQLRAARERLLAAYTVVRRTLDEATNELAVAMPEAKLAAELAGRRLAEEEGGDVEAEITLAQLEAEVAAAQEELGDIAGEDDGEHDVDVAAATSVEQEPAAEERAASGEEASSVVVVADAPAPVPEPQAEAAPEPEPEPVVQPEADPAPVAATDASQWFDPIDDPASLQTPSSRDDTMVEERKSSTLRIFRRRPPAPEPHHTLVTAGRDELEGVRIIRPEPEPEPEPAAVEEPAAAEDPAKPEVEPEPVAAEPAPEPVAEEPEVEVEVEPAAASAAEPEPEPAVEAEPAAAEVLPAAAPAPAAAARVDELFARMRAERAEAVAKAQAVLAEPREEQPVEPQPDAETEAPARAETSPAGADALARRDEAVAPIEQTLTRRLKRVLADEQNEVLDLLRRARGRITADQLLPPLADHVARYRDAADHALAEAWRAGAGVVAGDARPIPEDVIGELGSDLVEPLRARVDRAVAEVEGQEELDEAVRAVYREWRTRLADGAVRHVVLAAYSAGVYDAAPSDAKLCWLVDKGGVACPDADDNALAGALQKGEAFPTGHLRPPAHPRCRCLVIPDPG